MYIPYLYSMPNPKANDAGWTIPDLHAFCWLDSRRRRRPRTPISERLAIMLMPKRTDMSFGRVARYPASRKDLDYKEPDQSPS